jgi:aspartate carbamoyltransferase catalytic subunit
MTHLLSVDDLERDQVDALFATARAAEPIARRHKVCRALEGAVLGNLFFEASTRTRMSFAAAFCRLGGAVCDTTGFTFSSMAKGESIADTSRVISGYCDALVVRHPEQGAVAEFAKATYIPVVNGGDGPGEHPSQALLDLYTIETEFARLGKRVDGAHVAMVGDLRHGRTVHSLIKLLAQRSRMRFTLIAPPGLEMPSAICDQVAAHGHAIEFRSVLRQGLHDADLVYATRIQRERMSGEAREGYASEFRVDRAFVDTHCAASTLLMHPLPRDSSPGANDLSTDLDGDPRLAIFRQSDNGVAVRMAIFATLLGVESLLRREWREAPWRHPQRVGPLDAGFHTLDCG